MSRNDDDTPLTIAGLLEMQPGTKDAPTWVNQPLEPCEVASLEVRKTKTNQPFVTGILRDPDIDAEIGFSMFGKGTFPPVGSIVRVSGQGMSLGEYNGTPQLTIGQKAFVATIQASSTPAAAAPTRSVPPASKATQQPANSQGHYLGVTVGMSVNNGVAIALKACEAGGLEPGSLRFWNDVYHYASRLLRMSAVLESGNLAPKPDSASTDLSEKPAPAPTPTRHQPASRPKPGTNDSAFPEGADENVPF